MLNPIDKIISEDPGAAEKLMRAFMLFYFLDIIDKDEQWLCNLVLIHIGDYGR